MEQILFSNLKTFLETEKQCSNVEPEVPISEASSVVYHTEKVASLDVVGGHLYPNKYTTLELHCVEYKSPDDDIVKGIGQLFWYKFLMSTLNIWIDHLFLYLFLHEKSVSNKYLDFLKGHGFGLLQASQNQNLVTEIVIPEDQNGFVYRLAREKIKIRCSDILHCPKGREIKLEELKCPVCGSSIEIKGPTLPRNFADFTRGSTSNPDYQGAPDSMPKAIEESSLLRKVFRNWKLVKKKWKDKNS
ncbi:hypothetical protein J7K55_09135 [Candidatus Aerophobetes bacterium]|nr:hypothetical protein [Candidatus Aerophobetes bacterium]